MQVQPYLNFDGRCEEAVEFYRRVLDAEVTTLMRFKDNPQPSSAGMVPPGAENKVMHMSFRVGDVTILASDCHCAGKVSFQGFSLTLTLPSAAEAERRFAALAEGGQVQMPLGQTFFASRFGVLTDRFGMSWTLYVAP